MTDSPNLEEGRRLLREATPGWQANHINAYSVVSSQSHPIWKLSDDHHRQISDGKGGFFIGQDRELLLWLYDNAPALIEAAEGQKELFVRLDRATDQRLRLIARAESAEAALRDCINDHDLRAARAHFAKYGEKL